MPALDTGVIHLPSVQALGSGGSTYNITAVGDYFMTAFQIPETGTLTGIRFATATVTTGATITATLETIVDAKPSGVLFHANATGSVVVANTDDSVIKTVAFAGNVPVTRGQVGFLKVACPAGSPKTLGIRHAVALLAASFPYTYRYLSGVGTYSSTTLQTTLTYTTGDVTPLGLFFFQANSGLTPSTATSPDEIGVKITAPYSAQVMGIQFRTAVLSNMQDLDFILYDSNSSVLASVSLSKEVYETVPANQIDYSIIRVMFAADVDILKGRTYRVVIKPTTATTPSAFIQSTTNPVVTWDGAANPVYTYRTDGGAWTDDSARLAPLGLLVRKVYQPGGSFLLSPPSKASGSSCCTRCCSRASTSSTAASRRCTSGRGPAPSPSRSCCGTGRRSRACPWRRTRGGSSAP